MEELRVSSLKASRHCDLCGYSHFFPVSTYTEWIAQFGQHRVFKEGKKAGQVTLRTAQTERWEAIVEKHEEAEDATAS